MTLTRLIVTADDVGLHRGMTEGAVRAHREGIVTACSVAAAGADLGHAVDLLRGCPDLDVGVHLALVELAPMSPPSRIPSLTDGRGMLLPSHRAFAIRYALGRVSTAEVEVEMRAQIERVLAAGLSLRHVNGHQHVHVLPGVFDVVVRLAADYHIPYVRIPDDRATAGAPLARRAAISALGRLARRARARALAAGLRASDRTIGIADAGHLDTARLLRLLALVEGETELVAHPGIGGASIEQSYRWGYAWDAETDALCDPRVRDAIARAGIELGGIRPTPRAAAPPGPPPAP